MVRQLQFSKGTVCMMVTCLFARRNSSLRILQILSGQSKKQPAKKQPAWQRRVGERLNSASPRKRLALDRKARETRRNNSIKALLHKGKKLADTQDGEVQVLQIFCYQAKNKIKYVYWGTGDLKRRFEQGQVIESNLKLLHKPSTLKSLVPSTLPCVEVDTPSKSVVSPGSGARLAQEQLAKLAQVPTVRDSHTTVRAGMHRQSYSMIM